MIMAGHVGRPRGGRFEIVPAGNVVRIGNMDHWLSQRELTLAALVNNDSCIEWLATYGLLCNSRMCYRCRGNIPCLLSRRDRLVDGYIWRCPRCRADISIRLDSFFTKSHLSLITLLEFLYHWSEDNSQTKIMR